MEMNITGLGFTAASQKQFKQNASFNSPLKSGGQTTKRIVNQLESFSSASVSNIVEFKTGQLSDGFVLDGYFLGTFEFDSLTGHPGIRY
ncbi:hypothetical protein [Sabulibacter ruber]|uniref:hypothetical protein n=1 Tax=Sabulibacter ruber TaxID=2811901 RepID=UPI001A967895|nr:hypothetical protein [Sabulibacter ruber]